MLPFLTLLAALHAPPAAPSRGAADSVAGAWQITGDVMGNPLKELCTLKQTGTALTGKCTRTDDNSTLDVTGEVKDGKVTFKHGGDYQGAALTMVYTGTLPAPGAASREIKGTVEVQPFGATGTFTAAPAPPKP